MKNYKSTMLCALCAAINIPLIVWQGSQVNVFSLGWCSAATLALFLDERKAVVRSTGGNSNENRTQ